MKSSPCECRDDSNKTQIELENFGVLPASAGMIPISVKSILFNDCSPCECRDDS